MYPCVFQLRTISTTDEGKGCSQSSTRSVLYISFGSLFNIEINVANDARRVVLELLSEGYGGRVDLANVYLNGLSEFVRKYFKGNGVIASMEHYDNFVYLGTRQITLAGVGDDFWPCSDPDDLNGLDINDTYWLQGCHGALPKTAFRIIDFRNIDGGIDIVVKSGIALKALNLDCF